MSQPATHAVVACQGGALTAIERRATESPGAGEILLGLRVVGLCGTDLFKLENALAVPGTVLGHEVVGEVVAVGEGVTKFAVGDRVVVPHHVHCGTCALCVRGNETLCETFRENLLSPGAFSERILVRERATRLAAHKVPDTVSDEAAVFVEPAACVLRGVNRSGIFDAGLAIVQGGGSMGLLHLLVLKTAHPTLRVLIVNPIENRRELATQLGADAAAVPGEAAIEATRQLSDGLGADAVFDTVGGAAPLRAALTLSRQGGSVILFAHAPHGQDAGFDLNDLFKYERRIVGTYSGGLAEQATVFQWMTEGRFDPSPLATHQLTLDQFQTGIDLTRNREALKVLYRPTAAGTH